MRAGTTWSRIASNGSSTVVWPRRTTSCALLADDVSVDVPAPPAPARAAAPAARAAPSVAPAVAPRSAWRRAGLVTVGLVSVGLGGLLAVIAAIQHRPAPRDAGRVAPGIVSSPAPAPAPPPAEPPRGPTVAPPKVAAESAPDRPTGDRPAAEAAVERPPAARRPSAPGRARRDPTRCRRRAEAREQRACRAQQRRRKGSAQAAPEAASLGGPGGRVHLPVKRAMKTFLVASAVLVSWLAIAARAQAATAPSDAEGAASALVAEAARAYDQNQLDEALRLLARAYELSPRPSILYNQAQVLRAKNDCVAALDAYQRFIATTTPDDPNRERAVNRRAEMQTCVDKRSGAPVETKPEGASPAPPAPATAPEDAAANGSTAAPGPVRLAIADQTPPGQAPPVVADSQSPTSPADDAGARPPSRDARHRLGPGRGRRSRGGHRRGARLASARHPGRAEHHRRDMDPGPRGRGQTSRHPGAVVWSGRRGGRRRGSRAADRHPSDGGDGRRRGEPPRRPWSDGRERSDARTQCNAPHKRLPPWAQNGAAKSVPHYGMPLGMPASGTPTLGALAGLGVIWAISGCFNVNYGNCRITCDTDEDCPGSLTCVGTTGTGDASAPSRNDDLCPEHGRRRRCRRDGRGRRRRRRRDGWRRW